MINSTERSDILVFNCYLCHVSFLLTCYVRSTKIGEISDISRRFENFVSQTLGVLTRVYAAELRESRLLQQEATHSESRKVWYEGRILGAWEVVVYLVCVCQACKGRHLVRLP